MKKLNVVLVTVTKMNFELYAMRASGLIPVIPLIVINKDTQLPMYIEGEEIIY